MRVLLLTLTGFGNKVLDVLLEKDCEVKYLLTREKIKPFPFYKEEDIQEYARGKGAEVLDEFGWDDVAKIIEDWKPDLLLVASFHRIIPERIISSVPLSVNIHPSLLPEYRGPTPIDWALYNGERETGVTAHFLVKEIDAGDILIQKRIHIEKGDNKNTMMEKLAVLASEVAGELIGKIEGGTLKPVKQDVSKATYHPEFGKYMSEKSVVVVMGGSLKKDENSKWRTTNLDEGDDFGVTGDRLRVVAASYLHKNAPGRSILSLGGTGHYEDVKDMVPVSSVIKSELVDLGVSEDRIEVETNSGNTFQQLKELNKIIRESRFENVIIISNRYHILRIQSMIDCNKELKEEFGKIEVELVSAEDVLIEHNPEEWKEIIDSAYKSEEMKKRIKQEEEGVSQIIEGTYKLQ